MSNIIQFASVHNDTKEVIDALEKIAEQVRDGDSLGFIAITVNKADEVGMIGSFTQPVSRLKIRGMLHVASEVFLKETDD